MRKIAIPLIAFITIAARAQLEPVLPMTSVRVVDANGKYIGTPITMSPQEMRIAVIPNVVGATADDMILLSYTMTTRTRDRVARGKWSVYTQSYLWFDGPGCTGSAFTKYRDDIILRRIAGVTQEGRLYVSEPSFRPVRPMIRSAEGDGYDGEFLCLDNPTRLATEDLVAVTVIGNLESTFRGPFALSDLPRARSARH